MLSPTPVGIRFAAIHADQLDETIAQRLHLHRGIRPHAAHNDRGDDGHDHLIVQLRVKWLGFGSQCLHSNSGG